MSRRSLGWLAVGWLVGGVTLLTLEIAGPAAAQSEARGHGGAVRAVLAGPADRLVSGGFDSAVIVWDAPTATARRVLRHHDSTVNALAPLAGGCFASGGEDGRIAIWCDGKSAPERVLTGHTAPVAALAGLAGSNVLASAGWDRTVRLWPLDGGPSRTLTTHDGPVNGLAFLRDGTGIVSVGYDGQIKLTYLDAARAPRSVQGPTPVNSVAVAPDGEIVVGGADGAIRFLDDRLEPRGEVALTAGPLTVVAPSPDGATIAVAGLRTPVTVLDRMKREVRYEIVGPGLPVWAIAFSADGKSIFTGGQDRAVRRWDAVTGRAAGDVAPAEDLKPETASDPGARVFRACRACHGLTAADNHLAGPTLHGIFGRRIGTAPGYVYSDALKSMDIVWTPETVSRLFEIGPNAYTPGTKMPEQRLTDPEDRRALVEWLAKVTK